MSSKYDAPRADYVVTLVHGTFAKNAEWTKDGSFLCRELAKCMNGVQLRIERFFWSGRNSPASRHRAAKELRSKLREQIESTPDARHFIIGHSHGGAVALESVFRDARLPPLIAGVATLATPFIHVRARSKGSIDCEKALPWIFFLLISAICAWAYWWPSRYCHSSSKEVFVFSAAVIFWIYPGAYACLRAANWLARLTLRAAERTRSTLECAVPSDANVLIVRSSGDEASALLSTAQFLSWLVSQVWNLVFWLLRPLFRVFQSLQGNGTRTQQIGLAVWVLLFLVIVLRLWYALNYTLLTDQLAGRESSTNLLSPIVDMFSGSNSSFNDAFMCCIILICGSMVALPLLVLFAWLSLLFLVLLIPYGPACATASIRIQFSVESVPVGRWTVHQFGPLKGSHATLIHSTAYNDRRVVELLAAWMLK